MDAFASMGGGPGISGTVKKSIIIDIIKNQFNLTIEIEKMLEEITQDNELNFLDFCRLFEGQLEDSN